MEAGCEGLGKEAEMGGVVTDHLAYLRHLGRRPSSIDQRRWCLERFHRFLGRDLLTATYPELLEFVSRGGEDRGSDARCSEISHLNGFYGWLIENEYLEVNPAARLKRPRRPKRKPRPMPDHDLERALRTAPEPIRTWIALAAYGGLRCCEIAPLRGEDYRRRDAVLVLQEMKGGDTGEISVGPLLAEVLAGMPPSGWWFLRWDGVEAPMSAGQLGKHANRWLHDNGIAHTMHTGRHWYGTEVQRITKNIRVTMDAMRHLSMESTTGYTFVGGGEVANAVAQLPRL